MRKKTIKFGLDEIFWYIIKLLPIILTVCVLLGGFQTDWYRTLVIELDETDNTAYPFYSVFSNVLGEMLSSKFGITIISEPIVSFLEVFAPNENDALYDFFINNGLGAYISYLVVVECLHLFYDFIVFVPRLCHKWMAVFTRTED